MAEGGSAANAEAAEDRLDVMGLDGAASRS